MHRVRLFSGVDSQRIDMYDEVMSNLPAAPEIEGLEDLTERQMGFVQGILAGKTQSDAYRDAYTAENMTPNSIWCEASKLRSSPKVAQWLDQLRRQGMARGAVTLDGHLAELESLKQQAKATGNYGAAVKAEELRGKAAGVYLGDDSGRLAKVPAAQLIALIREGVGGDIGELAAQALAKRLGITLLPRPIVLEHVEDEAESA